jgi:hypothetical protein
VYASYCQARLSEKADDTSENAINKIFTAKEPPGENDNTSKFISITTLLKKDICEHEKCFT